MSVAQMQIFQANPPLVMAEAECELIERAKHDPGAFGLLYERFAPELLNYVLRRTGDLHATEDLVGDVFVIVMRSLPSYQNRGLPIRSWLMRIATNAVNHWARRQRKRACVALDEAHASKGSTPPADGDGRIEHLQRALLTLAPRYQTVLSLYHLEDLSIRETAAIIGCREGTVRSRLTRARGALRTVLNKRS